MCVGNIVDCAVVEIEVLQFTHGGLANHPFAGPNYRVCDFCTDGVEVKDERLVRNLQKTTLTTNGIGFERLVLVTTCQQQRCD